MSTSTENLALLDSNVLVIAHDRTRLHHAAAQAIELDVLTGRLPAALAHQNLLEWYSVITSPARVKHPLPPHQARSILEGYLRSDARILSPQPSTIAVLAELIAARPVKDGDVYDVYLAATALSYGITTILTENVKDFRKIPGITAINPFKATIS